MKNHFLKYGFGKLEKLISEEEVEKLKLLYDQLLKDKKRTIGLRSDLGGDAEENSEVEKITQIMRPGIIESRLLESTAYKEALKWAKQLLGKDMELDFDMLINKAPFTNTPTPWHQDAAYWINLPDKRAVSCWIALDKVTEANGCMWFIPKGPDLTIHPHQFYSKGGALYCETDTSQAQPIPLQPGGCTFHDGFTLHYSNGNSTTSQRRALILNFRPLEMITLERKQGVDHTGDRKVRNN
ncbi:phytanoyl-CoA dioxygenase family protein [Flexithrix dorotheae]|uniref:phytanoyl-CoA dioxygenase family protein n=1 Tax=Flexithrix dorotheae TaxID=70993 RepID=UPI00037C117B|nr:phytanoyl-CoA dioxygenase family protein [Flexithrix dorotheae]